MASPHPPRVRVVVLNWNSVWFSRRCLAALEATDYPAECLELVLVDNASVDGSLELLRYEFPNVRVIANEQNLGFAEGCNRAMRDLAQVDAVALVNNDAVPEPGWLWPLVEGLQSDPTVGAVAAGLVLEPEFTRVGLMVTGGQAQIESLSIGPISVLGRSQSKGMWSVGHPDWPMDLDYFVDGSASLLVPAGEGKRVISLRVTGTGNLTASTAFDSAQVALGKEPIELKLRAGDDRSELLNGLGTDLQENSEGYDRHFGEPAQMLKTEASETVPGFCGGGVLLRTAMLDQVGLFDPRFFAYYEDTDLAWRSRRAGWHIVTAPESVIRHSFGASAASASPGFFVHVYRNWIMTVLRNAEPDQRRRALSSIWARIKWAVRANVFSRLKHGHLPRTSLLFAWKRVAWTSLIQLPYLRTTRNKKIGAVPTDKVSGPLQPAAAARAPSSRPGGPLIVYLDINQDPQVAAELLTRVPEVESRIDLVPLVSHGDSPVGYRRAGSSEIRMLLGLQQQSSAARTQGLSLEEFAVGSVILRCEPKQISAKSATNQFLQDLPTGGTAVQCALGAAFPNQDSPERIKRVSLELFVQGLISRFGLP